MSCYNWAQGTIKIPTKEWSSFRKKIIQKYNYYNSLSFDLSRNIFSKIKQDSKYKRNYNLYDNVWDSICIPTDIPSSFRMLILDSLMTTNEDTNKWKLILPKKKSFPKANLKTKQYPYFSLNSETKSISFYVEENNRAVEAAFQDQFVSYVFRLLDNMTWTRNSGGTIVGNDEYNRDCSHEGGGGNYSIKVYGIKKERFFNAYYN